MVRHPLYLELKAEKTPDQFHTKPADFTMDGTLITPEFHDRDEPFSYSGQAK
jgi:hypothetical protein